MLHDTVKAKRRRRLLQKGVILARVTHVTKERFVHSRRMELDKPGVVADELKSMRRAGGDVQKITRPQGYLLFAGGHTHTSVQTEEGFGVFLMQVIWDAMSLGPICHQGKELAAALARIGE